MNIKTTLRFHLTPVRIDMIHNTDRKMYFNMCLFLNSVTYDDMHVDFTWEEWTLLNPSQKSLYKDVMVETYRNLTTIGYSWEDHNIEEHCQSSRRHERHEKCQTGEETSVYTQFVKAFACDSHLHRHGKTHTRLKPYEENECGKTFACHSSLRKHKRSHTDFLPGFALLCHRPKQIYSSTN